MNYTLLAILIVMVVGCFGNIEYDGWLNIRLQHSLGNDGEFVERGNVSIQSLRSGAASLLQAPLSPLQLQRLKTLSKNDDFYLLRSVAQLSDGTEASFLSSLKAETLIEGGLRDCVTVWLLPGGGVAGVALSPAGGEPGATGAHFTTEVYVRHTELAPVPDTASYIQKLEREREAREKGEFKDNRSFIAKYWMYIVPVAIFVLLSGAANPEAAAAR